MGLTASAASEVLRLLEEGRYVDDSRYARAFVRDKFMFARWGAARSGWRWQQSVYLRK